jgi:putative ABC transport system permease protein
MNTIALTFRLLWLVLDNTFRNPLRTILTALGTVALVLVVTLVYTVLNNLDRITQEKSSNLKLIATEKWQIPSQMPYRYAAGLSQGAAREPGDVKPEDYMSWGFFAGSTDSDANNRDFNSFLFAFVMEPEKILTMMDELDELSPTSQEYKELKAAVDRLQDNKRGIIVGLERLAKLNRKVGDRITLYSRNYKDINLELEIVGTFPAGRYDGSTVFRRDYLNAALDQYKQEKGTSHPLADKSLNLMWLRVPTREAFNQVATQITNSPEFSSPAVKVETASSGIGSFLDGYRDLLWGAKWLLAPACMATLALVISNSISISVRERQTEFAVMKVLGFQPFQILLLVIGEALLIGLTSGFFSATATYLVINEGMGGLPFKIGFLPTFDVPASAIFWGTVMGGGTALLGSILPAWSARTVKVSEVFSRVA